MAGSEQIGDQVISLTGNMLWDMARGSLRLGGKGGMQFAKFLAEIINQEKRTKGQVWLRTMLRTGVPTNVFSIEEAKLSTFAEEAKRFGVKYAAIKGKEEGGVINLLVYQQDAPRINKIIESIQERDSTISDVRRENNDKSIVNEFEKREPSVQLEGKDEFEKSWSGMDETDKELDGLENKEPSAELEGKDAFEKNWSDMGFTQALKETKHPSEQNLKDYQGSIRGTERKSVKAELEEIKTNLNSQKKTEPRNQKTSKINTTGSKKKKKKKTVAQGGKVNG